MMLALISHSVATWVLTQIGQLYMVDGRAVGVGDVPAVEVADEAPGTVRRADKRACTDQSSLEEQGQQEACHQVYAPPTRRLTGMST